MIIATAHLRNETWPRRSGSTDPVHAGWERGQPLDVGMAEDGTKRIPWHDEARYDPLTATVLFRRDHSLVTCYSVLDEQVTNDHGRAAREAVEATYGEPESHSQSTTPPETDR